MEKVIVRFAPSPTGYLHIGGARTAIFNWLYARKHQGKFILRIEDTDVQRSNVESIQGILDGLTWLGLNWDEGPYFQSQFITEHQAAAKRLLESGKAYKCFCSKDQLDKERDQARAQKITYQYNGACRHLTAQQVMEKEAAGQSFTIRLKVPKVKGSVIFNDLVYGTIEKKYQDMDDFIILRANGQPLYVLSNAVDDIRDGITHVIRGQDGLANTPKQVLLYQGLSTPVPKFAHMSLTLDANKAKISKRKHGEQVAIHYYRDHGFLPWAMVNFLVLLGWARTDSQTFFTKEELIRSFNIGGMNRTNSVFNVSADGGKHFTDPKLININAHYLRQTPIETLFPDVKDRLVKANIWQSSFDTDLKPWFLSVIELIRHRFNTLDDFVTYGQAYVGDDFPMDETAVCKHLNSDTVAQWMPELAQRLSGLNDFDANTLEAELRRFLDENKINPAILMNAMRTALTGQSVGPDFMKILTILGKERVIYRLKTAHRR